MKFEQRSVPKKSHNINKRSLWQTIWTTPASKQHISVYSNNNATSFVMAKLTWLRTNTFTHLCNNFEVNNHLWNFKKIIAKGKL